MLPKTKRLTAKDFKGLKPRLLYRGVLFDITGTPGKTARFACVISKKRIKRAVDRIKARRRVYAALARYNPAPYSFIIYPTKNLLTVSMQEIEQEMNTAFATL